MNMKLKRDQLFGVFFVLLGLACLVIIGTIQPVISLDPNDAGPKFFPKLISFGLIIFCVGMVILPDPDSEPYLTKKQWLRIAKYFGLLVLYLAGLQTVGFLIATPVCLFLMINMLAECRVIKWVAALYAILLTSAIYLIFTRVLVIILPRGFLFT